MKKFCTILLSILLVLQLCACGSSTDNAAPEGNYQGTSSIMGFDQGAVDLPSEPETPAPEAMDSVPDSIPKNAKLIYRGSLSLEATDFDRAVQGITALTEKSGGYFENSSLTNDVYRYAYYVIRIPSANYRNFFDQIGNYAQVNDQNHTVENISEQYYDTELRLETQKTKLARLQELLAKADTMADIITLETAISDTTLEIDFLTGSLRKYDSLVDFATIEVNLNEVSKLSHQQEPVVGFGAQLAQSFRIGTERFGDDLRWWILNLARNWANDLLNLAILAVVIYVAFRVVKKYRLRKSSKTEKPVKAQETEKAPKPDKK